MFPIGAASFTTLNKFRTMTLNDKLYLRADASAPNGPPRPPPIPPPKGFPPPPRPPPPWGPPPPPGGGGPPPVPASAFFSSLGPIPQVFPKRALKVNVAGPTL